ncbi:MAG: Na/Pi cotransporter family protein [Blautia sp.]|nr:Na/Pi cotransporter family protein [Blautia sp.]
MSPFDVLTLLGGLAMFLYGMRLMGDGLKQSSSGTLKVVMEKVTNNPIKAFLLGVAVTAIIQSSTATIVITSGLVAAGVLTLHQSLGIIIGANVGTTVTGQIIRLLDIDSSTGAFLQIFRPSTLAPLALVIGIVLIMGKSFRNSAAIGNIAIGFGILFSGLMNMTGAVSVLTESGVFERLLTGLGSNHPVGYLTGAGVAFILQSSSATIGILQAFSASGLLTFGAVYPVIVGIYLGDCVTTAIVCSIGQKAEARRTGVVNILFNLSETVLVLTVVALLHRMGLLGSLWDQKVNSGMIANTNTVFNLSCAIVLFPLINVYEMLSRKLVKDEPIPENPYKEKLVALNPAFYATPALALNSCYDLLLAQFRGAWANIRKSFELLQNYDESVKNEIDAEEENIDHLTDQVSKYMVGLLPNLKEPYQVGILDQYYKVVTDFERLGDHAVNIADGAKNMADANAEFSDMAKEEVKVMTDLLEEILELSEKAFEKRDVKAAYKIEPLVDVTEELTGKLKANHLKRMVEGKCNVYTDPTFMNLLNDMKRIADMCSNIGEATVVRAHPELANREHNYFSQLRSSDDFNKEYKKAYEKYVGRIDAAEAE